MTNIAIGVDVGGSHITCAAVDMDNEKMLPQTITETDVDSNMSADDIFSGWAMAINTCIKKAGNRHLLGIGFGMPGPFEYDKGIGRFENNEKFYSLNGVNVRDAMAQKLKTDKPLRFMNDASAFALGEAWQGSAAGFSNSVSITLGTGFGSAFISNSVPVVDGSNVPPMGCTWHLPYKDSIADNYFSTRWFEKRFKQLTGKNVKGVKAIAFKASYGNMMAKSIFYEYGRNLGDFLHPWLNLFQADVLVIGGNISAAYNLFGPDFEKALKRNDINTQIRISKLKEHAAIIGSAHLLDDDYWKKIKPVLPKM